MTEREREAYLYLCVTGRSREATDYREECERQPKPMQGPEDWREHLERRFNRVE